MLRMLIFSQCKKAVVAANTQITFLSSKYDNTVALSKYEEVRKSLETANSENEKLKEDLESAHMRYKSEASQKVEYVMALISKYRRLGDKPIEELTRIVEEEMQRAESGGLPTIARPSSSKSKAKSSMMEK
ncbi:unnamed protein product [Dibothriocephalus latus]|uniref:Uncharacterized protein n=1 Tax=Dibothriocephalus latus TaxID=60516 RepID=A0A3P7L2L8_DIBLA|nr:unnamed protein product [Dibothriocephalus latus]